MAKKKSNFDVVEYLKKNKKYIKLKAIESELGLPPATLWRATGGWGELPEKFVTPLRSFILRTILAVDTDLEPKSEITPQLIIVDGINSELEDPKKYMDEISGVSIEIGKATEAIATLKKDKAIKSLLRGATFCIRAAKLIEKKK